MNKKIKSFGIILLVIFSFYYTSHITEIIQNIDPIMKKIKENEDKFTINYINAVIEENTIQVGKKGYKINYSKSYQQMKKYGAYNETLMVLKEVPPEVSIEDNYDKFIIKGNKEERKIGLIFIVKENDNINKIIKILNDYHITATFFLDGTFLEKNTSLIKNNSNQEWEIKSYQEKINPTYLKTAISYLKTISPNDGKYCLGEEAINTCSKLKMHTIKPTMNLKKEIYRDIKNNLENGMLVSMECNNYVEKELPITINYLKSKGYEAVNLRDFLAE